MAQNKLFEKFKNVRALIIGDIMLDRYWWGTVERISPEAPVPVVKVRATTVTLGGAANVAANVAGLGAKAVLVGCIGDDEEGKLFGKLLKKSKIQDRSLLKLAKHPTTIKTRVIAHSQHVVRIDNEERVNLDNQIIKKLEKIVDGNLEKTDVVILSDYAKGIINREFVEKIIGKCVLLEKPVIVDPKGLDFTIYKNATILTPNKKESLEACSLTDLETDAIEKAGREIMRKANLKGLLITQGEHGMKVFEKNKPSVQLDSIARHVYDVTGAGDTVIAALAVAYSSGCSLVEAAKIANAAAGFVVEESGTTVIDFERLKNFQLN